MADANSTSTSSRLRSRRGTLTDAALSTGRCWSREIISVTASLIGVRPQSLHDLLRLTQGVGVDRALDLPLVERAEVVELHVGDLVHARQGNGSDAMLHDEVDGD